MAAEYDKRSCFRSGASESGKSLVYNTVKDDLFIQKSLYILKRGGRFTYTHCQTFPCFLPPISYCDYRPTYCCKFEVLNDSHGMQVLPNNSRWLPLHFEEGPILVEVGHCRRRISEGLKLEM